ncbi:hypothetical protein NLI96_g11284 [Meripilus lineatus]|uniref:Uncharacterized protein n=1 Tax=Meripilus lineatus TaxID=2056292 RepID=A0AAD5US16_9APHY|nr:hypothetical protein NLI96_g11284 [Physisporinus lineatus]
MTTREPAPFSPIAQEVLKRNIELVKENALVEFRVKSLQVLIEKDRDTIASQEVIIAEYKDKLAESEAKGRVLEDMLSDTTNDAQGLRERTRSLSEDLDDATTQIKFYESELRCKKDRILALEVAARDSVAKLDTVTGELETTRATLGLEISQLEAQLAQVRKEKDEKDAALQEEIWKLAKSGRELEEMRAKLAAEETEKVGLKIASEALEAKNATLEKALEEKEAELVRAHKDIEAAKEEIARLEATLKSTQEDLAGTQDSLAKEREDFALARQKHTIVQDTLTNRCSNLETSLAHTTKELVTTQSKLEDIKSALASGQDQLTTAESTVRERDAEIRDKNEEISGFHKQVAEDRERAQATIDAMDARILGLQDEVTETRNNWQEEADGLKERVKEEKDKLESALVEFEAFKEDANNRTASLDGRIDVLTGELKVKGRELEASAGKLRESDDKVGDLTTQLSALSQKNEDTVNNLTTTLKAKEHDLDVTRGELHDTTTALEQARRDAKEHNTVLGDRISTLSNSLESSQGELLISEAKVLALTTQLSEKDTALETLAQSHQTETAVLGDRIVLLTNDLESKNRDLDTSQREVRASNDKVAALQLQLAEQGEKLGTAQGVIEEMRVQHDDEVAKLKAYILALEKELEASKATPPTTSTPSHFDDIETSHCNLSQAAPHPAKPTSEQSCDAPTTSGESTRLSVTAVVSIPRADTPTEPSQQHAQPSRLRPTAVSFQPSCTSTRAPSVSSRLTPTAPTFAPRAVPILDAPRLHATTPTFVPRRQATTNTNTSLRPIATPFVPRQIAKPQLRGDATLIIPARRPSVAPLPAPPLVDSPRLPANAAEFVPGSPSVVLIPPQVGKIHEPNQEHEVPSTDTDSNTSGVPESVSSASLSTDSTLEFDDSIEAITRRESNYELSQLDSSKSLVKIASLISCPCLRVSF